MDIPPGHAGTDGEGAGRLRGGPRAPPQPPPSLPPPQLFGPLALAGAAVLLPINLSGTGVRQGVLGSAAAARAARPGYSTFSRFTLTNLPPGSPKHWAAFVYIWVMAFYTFWLVRVGAGAGWSSAPRGAPARGPPPPPPAPPPPRPARPPRRARQRYLTGGELLLSAWHDAYLTARRDGGGPALDDSCATAPSPSASKRSITTPRSRAALMAALRGAFGVSRALSGELSAAEAGADGTASPRGVASAAARAVERMATGRPGSAAWLGSTAQLARAASDGLRRASLDAPPPPAMRAALKRLSLRVPPHSASMPAGAVAEEEAPPPKAAPRGAADPVSRHETRPPAAGDRDRPIPWWRPPTVVDGGDEEKGGSRRASTAAPVGKPNVRDLKLVPAVAADGSLVAAPAEQYAVLVMDVPDLPAAHARTRARAERAGAGGPLVRATAAAGDFVATTLLGRRRLTVSAGVVAAARSRGGAGGAPKTPRKAGDATHPPPAPSIEAQLDDDVAVEPGVVVEETFRRLFPDTFLAAVPVKKHKEVDQLLLQWDGACAALEAAEAKVDAGHARPTRRARCCAGPRVDAVDALAARVRTLETRISAARDAALAARPSPSFFVFFTSQRDAAVAAQVNLQAEDGHSFRVIDAPGPEDVLWATLWMPWAERDARRALALPLAGALLLVPVGFFLGGVSQLTTSLCRLDGFRGATGALCGSAFMAALAALLPPLSLSLWNGVVLPHVLYWLTLSAGQSVSLSGLDRCEEGGEGRRAGRASSDSSHPPPRPLLPPPAA